MSSMQSRSTVHQREDSLVISDSDEETESPAKRRNFTDMEIIKDSDTECSNILTATSNDDGTESEYEGNSEDEDLHFINSSHRVSIVENSSESESDSSKSPVNYTTTRVKTLKRRSIYDSPSTSHTPKNESTPINSRTRKRARRIVESDSEEENITGDIKYQSADKSKSQYNDSQYKMTNKMNISETSFEEHRALNFTCKETSVDSFAEEKDIAEDKVRDESVPGHSELSTSSIDNSSSKNGSISPSVSKNIISANTNVVDLTINDSIRGENIDLTLDDYKKNDPQVSSNNRNFQEKQNISEVIISSSSTSETEMDKDVLSIARKELGVGNIDPIEAQKKEHLLINIDVSQKQLEKLNKVAASVDIDRLPDKGAKVHEKIKEEEQKIAKLKAKLEKLTQNRKTLNIQKKIKSPRETSDFSSKKHRNSVFSSDENKENIDVKNNIEKKAESNKSVTNRNAYSNHFNEFDIDDIPAVPQTSFDTADLGKKALETFNKQQSLTHKSLEQLHGSLVSRPPENKREPDPSGLKIQLMPHQQHALAWMKWRETQKPKGGILADDMGLGKTLTMISLVLDTIDNVRGNDSEDIDSDSDDGWYSRKKNHKKYKRYYGGTLVICPASLIKQWESEVNNRCKRGMLSVLVFHGNNRNIDDRKLSNFNIVITTYQTLVREAERETSMYKMEWNRVILDEAHYIRNHKSKACIAACGVNARYRWALTGTPIQNKEMDVFAILKYLQCSPFNDFQVWKRWVDNKNDAGKQRLITIMKTLMLRRTKQELQAKGQLECLPSKSSEIIEIEMDRDETLAYQKILLFSQNLFAQFLSQRAEKAHVRELYGGKFDRPSYASSGAKTHFTKAQKIMLDHHSNVEVHDILVLLLRLRQMCCHPALIHSMLDQNDADVNGLDDDNAHFSVLNKLNNMSINEDDSIEDYVANYKIDERVAANLLTKKNPVFHDNRQSSKVRRIIKTIEEIIEKGDKVVVVSQWTSFLEVIAKNLKRLDEAKYAMFTGAVAVKNRQAIVDKLNDPREDINILLLSLTAGGVGLNLVGANHLLLVDIHWNPQLEAQAQDRIYRFGQKKDVYIYKFICKDTIEERVKNLQDRKLEIANHVLTGTRTVSSKLTIDDLKSLFS